MTKRLYAKLCAVSVPHDTKLNKEQVIEELAHLILEALPLAERVVSDEFSPEDRRQLRELTAMNYGWTNAVFDMASLLNRLCGERDRREIR